LCGWGGGGVGLGVASSLLGIGQSN
jgi:hypothetical protein